MLLSCPVERFGLKRLGGVVGLRPIVRMWDLGLRGGVPSVGVFQRDPSPDLGELRRKPRKIPNG